MSASRPLADNSLMNPELGILKIATPCSEKWSKMTGDDRVRFCGKCQLKVYDFTQMDTEDVRSLLRAHEGRRVCARFFKRRDGRVMTRDCPRPAGARFTRAMALGGVVAVVVLAFISLVTLFGDPIRRQFGMSTMGALAGDPAPTGAQPPRRFTHQTVVDLDGTY